MVIQINAAVNFILRLFKHTPIYVSESIITIDGLIESH